MKFINTLGAAAALALGSTAAMAQVGAGFQVTSFSHVVSGGTLTWLGDSSFQQLFAESRPAGGLGGNDIEESEGIAQNVNLSTAAANVTAQVSAMGSGGVGGRVTAMPVFVDAFAQPHQGEARASQLVEFTLSQAGTVTFTVDYTLDASSPLNDPIYTYGFAELVFNAGNYDTNVYGEMTDSVDSLMLPGGSGSRSGTFTLTVALDGPQQMGYYNFNGNAFGSAVSAVPEPGEWALMLAGLGMLGGWRLRQQRLAAAQGVAA